MTTITTTRATKKRKSKSSHNNNNNNNNKHHNPLANARSSSSNNFYQDLWDKKSGLGYSLFVQYYGQQPQECCVCSINNKTDNKTATIHNSDNNKTDDAAVNDKSNGIAPTVARQQQAMNNSGMSRAAKRRRKKKGTINNTTTITMSQQHLPNADESKIVNGGNGINSVPSLPSQNNSSSASKNTSTLMSSPPASSLLLLQVLDKNPTYSHLLPFIQAMSKPLPLTFRLRNIRHYTDVSKSSEDMKALQLELQALNDFCLPTPFDATIYQARSSSSSSPMHKSILGTSCPALKELLVRASSQGLVARQELGSMLPVMGLYRGKHLKTNARVLDTCASPGSKTLQILEVVGPKGRVIANDIHPKRLAALQEAVLRRSGMPHVDRIVFTNYDASMFPLFQQKTEQQQRRPHVVVCDVPCSGDGTIRKDPTTVLRGWSPVAARALHDLQCRILRRALELVRVGGVVSYSTCSLNPVENEAVVQSVLLIPGLLWKDHNHVDNTNEDDDNADADVAVELLEWPDIEGLILRPGVTTWKVLDYQQDAVDVDDDENGDDESNSAVQRQWKEYASYEEAKEANMVHCYPTLWPIVKNHKNIKMNEALTRCRRLLPQDQDTGGFFVALLRKKAELAHSNKHK